VIQSATDTTGLNRAPDAGPNDDQHAEAEYVGQRFSND
jgi:hypothetical protein